MPKVYYAGHARHWRLPYPEVPAMSTPDGIPADPPHETDIANVAADMKIFRYGQDARKSRRNKDGIYG